MSEFEQVLLHIIKSLKSTYGNEFFNELSLQLSKAIGADYTFIAQVDVNNFNANTISLIAKGELADNFEYKLEHTPCAKVIDDSVCIYPRNIRSLFPRDQLLIDMNFEGYVGVALYDSNGKVNGLVVALYETEMSNTHFVKNLFELFSGRIAAEIERCEQKQNLEQLNTALAEKMNALVKSEAKLSIHLQNTPLGCITWDTSFKCIEWNKAAERIFGYSAKEAIDRHASNLIVPSEIKDEINDLYQNLLEQKSGFQNTNENVTKSGNIIKCDWYNTPIVDDNDIVIGVSSLILDITEKEQQEQLLQRSQKMDALGKLTGGIAHDQNNMLGVILGYSELLSMKLKGQPKILNYAKNIQHAAQRGAQLIGKLLSLSRKNALTESITNINAVLISQQDTLQKTLTVQITLELELSNNGWSVWLDQHDLEDAIFNLCINAMDAMKETKSSNKLKISTTNVTLNNTEAKNIGMHKGEYFKLCIADNGSGMSETLKSKIFDPFFSTKGDEGTGLGLSQVFSFVNRSKGCIEVKSKVGMGTNFTLYFPRYNKNVEKKNCYLEKVESASYQGNETILVVDDEQALCSLCSEILSMQGYKILCAHDYKEALEVLEGEKVDLMVSDVIMPDMNGYQLSSIAQKKYPAMKIQLVSGYAKTKELGCIDNVDSSLLKGLINKPYDAELLCLRIRHLLDN